MKNLVSFLLLLAKSVAYGLAIAMLYLLLAPSGRQQLFALWPHAQKMPAPVSYSTAIHAAAPAVVNVYTRSTQLDQSSFQRRVIQNLSLGSGVIMRSDGYILTNFHVVNGADQILVALQDGRQLDALLIGQDQMTDLAVLKVQAEDLPVIPQQADIAPQVGDLVLAIGNPLNLGQSITQGIISATGRAGLSTNNYTDFMQMDAAINEGNSGGALVNSNGVLVGINTAAFQRQRNLEVQGIFFAVPYPLARTVLDKLIKHGRVTRGYLGFNGNPVTNAGGEPQVSTGQPFYGVLIDQVEAFGPADRAGLRGGDILLQVAGTQLTSVGQALDIVAETEPGSTIDLLVERQGQRQLLKCQIGNRPDS